jgi:hypothetical protein
MTAATEANRKGKQLIGGKYVYRDRVEWIAVKVPAIVSQELFDKVQEKLREHKERYSTPSRTTFCLVSFNAAAAEAGFQPPLVTTQKFSARGR